MKIRTLYLGMLFSVVGFGGSVFCSEGSAGVVGAGALVGGGAPVAEDVVGVQDAIEEIKMFAKDIGIGCGPELGKKLLSLCRANAKFLEGDDTLFEDARERFYEMLATAMPAESDEFKVRREPLFESDVNVESRRLAVGLSKLFIDIYEKLGFELNDGLKGNLTSFLAKSVKNAQFKIAIQSSLLDSREATRDAKDILNSSLMRFFDSQIEPFVDNRTTLKFRRLISLIQLKVSQKHPAFRSW